MRAKAAMISRQELIRFLNKYLRTEFVRDSSLNGLQVEGSENVSGAVFGVSASLALFKKAAAARADMVIVHHGLFWSRQETITGNLKKRIDVLIRNNMSLAAYHLPLDMHTEIGNNAVLMRHMGASGLKPFGMHDGQKIGFLGTLKTPVSVAAFSHILSSKTASEPRIFAFGPRMIRRIAAVSGGGASMLEQAAAEKADLYITGESAEYTQEQCREYGINFIGLGHYNSEKTGIQALQQLISSKFRIRTEFIDIPNPV